MAHETQWQVEMFIDEQDRKTRAEVRLRTRDGEVVGAGTARCNPADANVPEIGDELAAARAFSDLAHKLLDLAAGDIEGITHRPVHLAG